MSASSLGTAAEHAVKKELERLRYWVIRGSNSLGPADLIALRPGGGVLVVQVKRGTDGMRPPEWNRLLSRAQFYGAVPVLAEWIPYKPTRWWHLDGPKVEGGSARQPRSGFDPAATAWAVPADGSRPAFALSVGTGRLSGDSRMDLLIRKGSPS
jgi:hypothetical protein